MRCGSRSGMRGWSATRRCTSRSACAPTAPRKFSACGSSKVRAAKFWLRVINELKNRGVEDVLIAVVDGLKGFPEAITAFFPRATVQTCIVHLLRHSLDFVSWKDRKPVAAALKGIYRGRRRRWRSRTDCLRGGLLGQEIPRHRPELAPGLGRGHSVLCLPRRGAANFIHHE